MNVLERFDMKECRPMAIPMTDSTMADLEKSSPATNKRMYQELMGAFLYISTRTRPDIYAAVYLLCRYMSEPTDLHWKMAKRILRYLKGTSGYMLRLGCGKPEALEVFCDADWAGDRTDGRSTTGTVLTLGSKTVACKSLKQRSVALSTTEAEFISLSEGTKLVVWVRKLLEELDSSQAGSAAINEENQGAVVWSNIGVRKAKHVSVRFVTNGTVDIKYFNTKDMTANALTKPLGRITFER